MPAPSRNSVLAASMFLVALLSFTVLLSAVLSSEGSPASLPTRLSQDVTSRSRWAREQLRNVPLVTVVSVVTPGMPVWDVEQAAACLTNQTLSTWEWLIIDDSPPPGPPPGVQAQLNAVSRLPNMRIVRLAELPFLNETACATAAAGQGEETRAAQPSASLLPCGYGIARAFGVQLARAEHVLLLDGDTVMAPTALEKFAWYLHTHPTAAFVTSQYHDVQPATPDADGGLTLVAVEVNPSVVFAFDHAAPSTSLHRTSSLRRVGMSLTPGPLAALETWLAYVDAGSWGGTVREPLITRVPYTDPPDHYLNVAMAFQAAYATRKARAWEEAFPEPPTVHAAIFPLGPLTQLSTGRVREQSACRIMMLVPMMTIGGAERFNLDVLRHFTSLGCTITLVMDHTRDVPWYPLLLQHTTDVWVLENLAPPTGFLDIVHNLLVSRNIQCVWLSNAEYGYMMLPYLRAVFPDVAVVAYNHMEALAWKDGGYARYSVVMQPYLDVIFTSSYHVADWMVQVGADNSNVEVEYTGADLALYQRNASIRAEVRGFIGAGPNDVVVLYAHRLVPLKQPVLFAKLVNAVVRRVRPASKGVVHFVIGGSGPKEEEMLAELARAPAATVSQLHWLGALSPSEMSEVMQGVDILFLPSLQEGVPLVFFEAMSLGVVVVGTAVGGIPELVQHDVTGMLVPREQASNLVSLTDALMHVVDNADVRHRMSAASIARARTFDQHTAVSRILARMYDMRIARKAAFPTGCTADTDTEAYAHDCAAKAVAAREAFMWGARMELDNKLVHY